MSRTLTAGIVTSVMALALTLSNVAMADGEEPAVTPKVEQPKVEPPKVEQPKAPVVAAVVTAAPVVAAAPKATATATVLTAAPTPVPAPVPAPTQAAAPVEAPKAAAPVAAPIPAPAAPAPVAKADEPSSLPLRPASKPLQFAENQETTHTSWAYKALFGAIVAAGGYIAWKRKKKNGGAPAKALGPHVKVVGKTSMGLRGEIALIEAGGMRVLVGITSGSMTTLAVLPDEDSTTDDVDSGEPVIRTKPLFASKDLGPPIPARAVANFAANRYADDEPMEAPLKMAVDRIADSMRPPPRMTRTSAPPPAFESSRRASASEAPRALEGQARGLALALAGNKQR